MTELSDRTRNASENLFLECNAKRKPIVCTMCVCVCVWVRERDRDTQIHTERIRDAEKDAHAHTHPMTSVMSI